MNRRLLLSAACLVALAAAMVGVPPGQNLAVARASGCKKIVTVVISVETHWDVTSLGNLRNGCWGYVRPAVRPGGNAYPECRLNNSNPKYYWAYNEIASSSAYINRDLSHLPHCRGYASAYSASVNGWTYGFLFYAFDVPRQHWETTGHIPSGIGSYARVLELYGGVVGNHNHDVTTPNAYSLWVNTYRAQGFYAMVNFAGTQGNAGNAVYNVCANTANRGIVGLYGGSSETDQLNSSSRMRAVAQALNRCTGN